MFELFGIIPLIKILFIFFLSAYCSFFIGRAITIQTTQNRGIHLFIGLSALIAFIAIYNSKGLTVFTPSLLSIFILFRPKFQWTNFQWQSALKDSIQLLGLFFPFLLFELYRQSYFSNEFVNGSFGDYQYYVDAAENIWKGGVESSGAYLLNFDLPTATNIYHYYDLYLLIPIFIFKIPPLIGYLFFLLPLIYSIGVFSLISLTSSNTSKILLALLAFLALHVPGIELPEMTSFNRLSAVHYPKACLMLIPILLLTLHDRWGLTKTLIASTILSLMINPLIFILIAAGSGGIFLIYKKREQLTFASLFRIEYLVIYVSFIVYFVFVFFLSPKSDHSGLFTFIDNPTLVEYFTAVKNRFVGYSGVIKKLPVLVISILILIYQFYKTKKIALELVFMTVVFVIGHVVNSLMYNHYEGMQFFNLSIVTLIALYFFYAIKDLSMKVSLPQKIGASLLVVVLFSQYFIAEGNTLFTQPRSLYKSSVAYNLKLKDAVKDKAEINALFFRKYNKDTHWILAIPHLTYGLGYINLYQNANSILPTHPNMFLESNTVKQNAINLISRSPFGIYCKASNLYPTSFYDRDFELAIKGFIEKHNINVLVFEKEVEIPEWVQEVNPVVQINTNSESDNHVAFVL
jgi:hypothetical protein